MDYISKFYIVRSNLLQGGLFYTMQNQTFIHPTQTLASHQAQLKGRLGMVIAMLSYLCTYDQSNVAWPTMNPKPCHDKQELTLDSTLVPNNKHY